MSVAPGRAREGGATRGKALPTSIEEIGRPEAPGFKRRFQFAQPIGFKLASTFGTNAKLGGDFSQRFDWFTAQSAWPSVI